MSEISSANLTFDRDHPFFTSASYIIRKLRENDFEGYLVGGCVRDAIMNHPPKDYDIATSATPAEVAELFERTIPVGESFGVMTVVENGHPFEVATFRAEADYQDGRRPNHVEFTHAEADAVRRDFTINAFFYDPINDLLVDFCNGMADLKSETIRAIGNPIERFTEDYLRMLRAVRFAARFNYTLEPNTFAAIQKNAAHISDISVERIFHEIDRILTGPNPHRGIQLLEETGLIQYILPEFLELKDCPQSPKYHPEGDVRVHTLKALSLLPESPSSALAWATLLHDIGKPQKTVVKGDKISAHGHENVGSEMAKRILMRLRASNKLVKEVCEIVKNHMKFRCVMEMRTATRKRFMANEHFETSLAFHRIDSLAGCGDLTHYHFLTDLITSVKHDGGTLALPKPIIDGAFLTHYGEKPGPHFKRILEAAMDAQLNGKINSTADAENWLKKNLNNFRK